MQNLEIEFIWKKPRRKNTYIPPHSHNFYELVFYTSGSGITTLEGTVYDFGSNTFALISPGTLHDEQHLTDSEVICLGFSCEDVLTEMFFTNNASTILKVLKDILRESSNQEPDYQSMIFTKLNELYILLKRIQHPKSACPKNFEHIINYISENYHEKIQLASFSGQLHLSYDYFQHKFKQLTGLSPQQFLLNRRLDVAKQLLLQGNLSCTEVAYRCGFSTPAQFSMLFKKTHGISPLNFKKGHH